MIEFWAISGVMVGFEIANAKDAYGEDFEFDHSIVIDLLIFRVVISF